MKRVILFLVISVFCDQSNGQTTFSKNEFVKSVTFVTFNALGGNPIWNKNYYFEFKDKTLKTDSFYYYPRRHSPHSYFSPFDISITDSSKIMKASRLLDFITSDMMLKMKPTTIYGCPDCRDGGGIYIRLEFQHWSKVIMLPYGIKDYQYHAKLKIPDDVYKLAQVILKIIEDLE